MKPTGRCQGSGIFLVDKISQVAPYRNKPVQSNENNYNKANDKTQRLNPRMA